MNVPSFKVKDGVDLGQKKKKDNTSTKLEKRKRRDDFQEVEKSVYWTLIFSIKWVGRSREEKEKHKNQFWKMEKLR